MAKVVEKKTKGLIDGFLGKITPNGGRIISIAITVILLVLFLATNTGRSIIVFFGYFAFIALILLLGYKLYLYLYNNARGVPKEKPIPAEDSTVDEADEVDESETEEGHQITMDELQEMTPSDDVQDDSAEDDFTNDDVK